MKFSASRALAQDKKITRPSKLLKYYDHPKYDDLYQNFVQRVENIDYITENCDCFISSNC